MEEEETDSDGEEERDKRDVLFFGIVGHNKVRKRRNGCCRK